MKLPARLVVTTVIVTIPVVVMLTWRDQGARHRAAREDLEALTRRFMQDAAERQRRQCEAAPEAWGGVPLPPPEPPLRDHAHPFLHGRGVPASRPGDAPPRLYAYGPDLRSANRNAPELSSLVLDPIWPGSEVLVLVAMPWKEGPCAFVLARGTTNRRWVGALLPSNLVWAAPVFAILAGMLISIGFVVRRIRRLTAAVTESAAASFTGRVPIEGDDEVTELARAFEAARAALRRELGLRVESERYLREFLANTTHDVMIPLTVLQAHIERLVSDLREPMPSVRGALTGLAREAHYLGALMSNLSATAKLDAGDRMIVRSAVLLNPLVERVVARHRPIAEQLGVAIECAVPDEPVEIQGDETLLEQALNNLVDNATRYNQAGGHVAVTLDSRRGQFRLVVMDDGPGVPEAEFANLAARGYRRDPARSRAPGGQGLGLDIVRRVAALHGIALTFARSEYGGLQVELAHHAGTATTSSAT